MSGLVSLQQGVDWTASGGLFDFTLGFLIPRLADREAADWLQQVVDNNLGSVWLSQFPPRTRSEIMSHLRSGIVAAAKRDLPDSEYKAGALRQLQELVELTYQVEAQS